ncbi:PQQ-binding-like beta-propeller repeat protein [Pseudaminobacter soli (ex Zhang et al. 2022)]|uniref:outer membrane protein assembly factor BamB family protein n=1 Tax=Pseudaminobacter soli (ex Zhang et al. 2022) TaxID=2831468 RepID=UPI001F25A82A|nr:PQQ-binding-like beta-propeller repeat protein [Pseudaminobacter soli]
MNNLNRSAAIVTWALLTCVGVPTVGQADNQQPNTDWRGYNGGYDATRFSPLTQIDTKNVAILQELARFQIPETMSFQSEPVVIGDTIYVTTRENTYAIDARTGAQRWVRHHQLADPGSPGRLGRGVAYSDGHLFRGLVDGHVLSLDAKTGDVIWDVVGADIKAGEFYTAAPVVWDGRVYLGNAGSDYGGIGHVRAFDAKTGQLLWNFDTVPSTGDAAKTWPEDPSRSRPAAARTRPTRSIPRPDFSIRRSATPVRTSFAITARATISTPAA